MIVKTNLVMKWIREPIPCTVGYTEQLLALTPSEAVVLARVLQKPLKEYRKRLEYLNDVHEVGEATTRQENRRMELEDLIAVIEMFNKLTEP